MAALTSTYLAIASLVAGTASEVYSTEQQQAAASDQKNASLTAAADKKQQIINQKRNQIRQGRIRQAQILQMSADTGTTASSGSLGGISSVGTQVGSNLANSNRAVNTSNALTSISQDYYNHQSNALLFGEVGKLGVGLSGMIMQNPNLFNTKKHNGITGSLLDVGGLTTNLPF